MMVQKLEEITGKLCDRYCIYSRIFSSEEEQEKLDDICKTCPMNGLFDLLDILPPAKVGQEVYHLFDKQGIVSAKIKRIQINKNGMHLCDRYSVMHISELGKTLFLSKEGAEQALAERGADNE